MKKKWWIFLIASPLLAIILATVKVYYSVAIWKYPGPDVTFHIRPGETFSKINYHLHIENLIHNPKVFHRYSQINGIMTKFKSGQYLIKSNSNMLEVIETLLYGSPLTVSVTIPEGTNMYEIAKELELKGITSAKQFLEKARDPGLLSKLEIPGNSMEGYLYPETYNLTADTPAEQVITVMVKQFRKKIESLDFSKSTLPLSSVVILASIVEKETGAGTERPMIAGVFHNRLKKKMRLQSDPTTIYGIYERYQGNLKKEHLNEKTPYNTYKIDGLPVGPICNPGLQALHAVLGPAQHDFYFFVSQNDGTHVFTSTYKEHNEAVIKWQKDSRNRKGKSWRNLKQSN